LLDLLAPSIPMAHSILRVGLTARAVAASKQARGMIQEEAAALKAFAELLELWGALVGILVRHD